MSFVRLLEHLFDLKRKKEKLDTSTSKSIMHKSLKRGLFWCCFWNLKTFEFDYILLCSSYWNVVNDDLTYYKVILSFIQCPSYFGKYQLILQESHAEMSYYLNMVMLKDPQEDKSFFSKRPSLHQAKREPFLKSINNEYY